MGLIKEILQALMDKTVCRLKKNGSPNEKNDGGSVCRCILCVIVHKTLHKIRYIPTPTYFYTC